VDIDWYDDQVLTKTSEISRQIFPIVIDHRHPRWQRNLGRLRRALADQEAAQARGGLGGMLGRLWAGARAGAAFAGLYLTPVKRNTPPESSRLEPMY